MSDCERKNGRPCEYPACRTPDGYCAHVPRHPFSPDSAIGTIIDALHEEPPPALPSSEIEDLLTGLTTKDFRLAPSGAGPLAGQWADKPHRLVYDLAKAVDSLADRLRSQREELATLKQSLKAEP